MELFRKLNEERKIVPEGTYAPYYYRFLGHRRDLSAEPAALRANGICALFTETEPVIEKSELILGNTKCLYTDADEIRLDYARKMDESYGRRQFLTNADHFAPDYPHVLKAGIPGMISEINASLEKFRSDTEKTKTLSAMKQTLEAFIRMILNYASKADEMKNLSGYDKAVLTLASADCRAIASGAPETFRQALQLMWFCHNAFLMEDRYAMAFGRMDQFLYPFYKKDRDEGKINDEEVIILLENIFIRLQDDVVNICVGGCEKDKSTSVNELSFLILEAVKRCGVPGPNLSARISESTPDKFLDECLKSVGTGLGYPALMNDEVNIPSLLKYGYKEEDAYGYCMVGCIENFMPGKQVPWSDGRYDAPRCFDYVFNHGVSETNRSFGPDPGDIEDMKTMDDFLSAYAMELEYTADEYIAKFRSRNESLNQKYMPEPFLSCFCSDCAGRGLDINDGGAEYPSVHGAALMGIGTVADSLAAVEKVVFTDREATLSELRDALNADFEGYGELREKLLAAPKYGNNDDFADKYAVWYLDFLSGVFEKYRTRDGGGIYLGMASNTANIPAGKTINATPDGRKRHSPLSDAASPTYGRDVRGTTATMLSLSKPDYTKSACGTVVNQKYSPAMFGDGKREKLLSLIRTYFKLGGQEIQINATSPEILRDAMAHPENYENLVVRVSGFSAFYTQLDRDVQEDILARTQKDE